MHAIINTTFLRYRKSRVSFSFQLNSWNLEIETERLIIYSYKESDFDNCLSLYGNEEITKYFDHGKPRKKSEIEELILERGHKYFSEGKPFGLFSIFQKKDRAFIGQIDLMPTKEPGVVEIGFILNRKYHNQGFCTEAVQSVLFDYVDELNFRGPVCDELPIIKVIATVHPLNLSSRRVLEKIGMSFDKIQERFGNVRLWYSIPIATATSQFSKMGM